MDYTILEREAQSNRQGASSADPADSTDQPSDPIPSEAVAAADPIPGSEEPTAEASTLAVAEHEVAGIEVDLLDVSRTGDAITVRWQYRTELENGVTLKDGDGNDNDPYTLTRGAYLFDEAHQKKYLVLEDDAGRPIAAEHTHDDDAGVVVRADAPLAAWAKFPAPLDDVEQIAVHLPGVGPFEDVAIGQ